MKKLADCLERIKLKIFLPLLSGSFNKNPKKTIPIAKYALKAIVSSLGKKFSKIIDNPKKKTIRLNTFFNLTFKIKTPPL